MARLNEYPDGTYRELREAAASYVGLSADHVVVGAGADDLILLLAQVFLGPGRRAAVAAPTYALYRIATTLRGADVVAAGEDADLHWVCNPDNPTGSWVEPEEIAALAERAPQAIVVADEAYVEYGARSCAPWVDELPNLVVLRTLSKAFGFASLRVGYALAHPDTAALLTERRAPAPIAGPAAAIASAALRNPRLGDVEATIVERERVRSALADAGFDVEPTATNFVYLRTSEPLAETLERQGMVVRAFPDGIRISIRRPSENDVLLRALGAEPGERCRPRGDRAADDHRDRAPADALARRDGAQPRRDGHRVRRPPPDPARLPRRVRPRARGRGRPRRRRAPHRRGRPRGARVGARAGARVARGRRPVRIGGRADGRGSRHRRGRPRAATARRDRADLRERPRRRARGLAARARARALRDRGGLAPCTSRLRGATTTTWRRRRTRRSARRCGRRSRSRAKGIRSTKGAA